MIITLEGFRKTIKENREWKEVVELSVNDRVLSGEATLRDIFDYFEPDLGESDNFSGHGHTIDFSTLYEYTVDIDNGSLTINELDITVKYDIGLSETDVRGIHKRLASKVNILVNYIKEENKVNGEFYEIGGRTILKSLNDDIYDLGDNPSISAVKKIKKLPLEAKPLDYDDTVYIWKGILNTINAEY